MIELRLYRPDDYFRINRRKFDLLTFLNFPNPKNISETLAKGPAFTGLIDEEILACGGIIPFWKGVGEAWVVTSHFVCEYPLFFAKTIWRKLNGLIILMNLERIQTVVDAENIVSRKWVERMGFVNEGPMRKYIGGRTYIRYAWIKE